MGTNVKKRACSREKLPFVRCECGAEVFLVADAELMEKAIDDHLKEHKCSANIKQLKQHLTNQILKKAIKTQTTKLHVTEQIRYCSVQNIPENCFSKLKNAERLAVIGQTAGMVGHDLRNPLQAIVGEVYLAKSELKLMPKNEHKTNLQENITAIEEQITYMDKIISDLQTFTKPVRAHKQMVEIKPLLVDLLSNMDIPKNIRTSIMVDDNLTAYVDYSLLKRALINLVINSVQAMLDGGELFLKAQINKANQVQIIVKDTGVGIPDEIKPKLFTPLITTKAKGQGFGLAVCKRVLEAQGGTISFESQQNKGTTFTITLPCK